jgi:DNA-binding LacI/PurR family transcriptional regulator
MPTQAMQGVIGIVRPAEAADHENTDPSYYDEVIRGALAGICCSSSSLLITYLHGSHQRDFLRLQALAGQVDGLLVGDDILPSQLLVQLAKQVPVVVIPSLTTVQQPWRLIGERACALLLERIARPELAPRTELSATELGLGLPRDSMDVLDLAGIR